ncbi:MAG: hypothetical protein MI810_21355 [Flavobacteriales bacterium]|nr:hypothetical protein [Flavobacteriales bacterium]
MSKTKKIIQISTVIGAICWIVVIALRHNHIPTGGDWYLIAPWLLCLGLFIMSLRYAIQEIRGHKKSIVEGKKRHDSSGVAVGLILTFWTLCGVLAMLIITSMPLVFKTSEAFDFITKHIENDQSIQTKTGEIYSYSTIISGSVGSSGANLNFTIYAENSNRDVHFAGHKENGKWIIDYLSVE